MKIVSSTECNIGRFLFLPGRKVCGYIFELDPRHGVLKELSDISSKAHVIELSVNLSMPFTGQDGKICGFAFADLTGATYSAEEIAEKIRKIKGGKKGFSCKADCRGLRRRLYTS